MVDAAGETALVSMNCWRFDDRIFAACRDVARSRSRRVRAAAGRDARGRARGSLPCHPRERDRARSFTTRRRSRAVPPPGPRHTQAVKAVSFVEQLAAAGLEANQVEPKLHLFDRVLSTLQAMSGHGPDYVGWVPGRLEVFGTHTDYAGGRTLVSAVPRGFAFAAKQRTDGQLHVVDALASGESVRPGHPTTHALHGLASLRRDCHRSACPQFPRRSARRRHRLCQRPPARRRHEQLERAHRRHRRHAHPSLAACATIPNGAPTFAGRWTRPGIYACIENGRTFGLLAGNAGVGTHGGSEDHAAMVCGEPGAMTAFSFVPMRRLHSVRLPPDWEMVVATSGVAAEKTGAALEPYNRLAQGTAILLDIWNTHERPMGSLGAALASDPAAATHLETLAGTARVAVVERGTSQPPASLLARRCAGRRGCRRTQRQPTASD